MEYKRRVWAEINIAHLLHNLRAVRRHMPDGVKLMAVVKADAYGHGAVEIAKVLVQNGTEALGVATCEEGIQLRESGITVPILIFGFTPEPLLKEVIRHKLTQTVFSAETANLLAETAARLNTASDVHIKIDTGMGRLGFLPQPASIKKILDIAQLKTLRITGMYTHFATSDATDIGFMQEQQQRFDWVRTQLGGSGFALPLYHAANSGAFAQTLRTGNKSDGLFMGMIRVGILLYGLLPSAEMAETCAVLGLKPAMRLLTQVGMVKQLPPGSGVSYGHMFVTERETRIATLPLGYADGYPRLLSNKAKVLINGHYAPMVGAICMDQCMADVTDIAHVNPGAQAVLFGDGKLTADDLAETIRTIGYEIICGIGKRVPRVYING